jgi:hypothetical protein
VLVAGVIVMAVIVRVLVMAVAVVVLVVVLVFVGGVVVLKGHAAIVGASDPAYPRRVRPARGHDPEWVEANT